MLHVEMVSERDPDPTAQIMQMLESENALLRSESTSPQPMPALTVTTNVSLTKEQKHTFLKAASKAVAGALGKPAVVSSRLVQR